ncbi:MAG: 50S ribosomal protein L1 [Acidimicrobiia bacterium]
MAVSKKLNDAATKVDRDKSYGALEAFSLLTSISKESAKRAFDESVDVVFRLGVDPRKADQMIRGSVALPNGTGKTVRIAVFAQGEAATAAKEAGADIVGADELVTDVEKGMMDFDLVIAAPDMMAKVGKLGRALGPRGLMPNPKTGTVTPDVAKAVSEFKSGKVEYRTDKDGNVHIRIGKASFEPEKLAENFASALDEIQRAKPASSKGKYIKNISTSTTMGPGIRIEIG